MLKLIVAIFEGADYNILYNLMKANLTPNFKKLSYFNKCRCSLIPYEAAGLMSIFSGIPEKEHGISSYWRSQNTNYIPELWTSNDVKSHMLWNNLKNKDRIFSIMNLWGTHPVYNINGSILSYCMQKSLRYCYPADLNNKLIKNNYKYVQDTCVIHNETSIKENFCKDVLNIDMLRHKCIDYFEKNSDIIIVNYTAIDRISHFYYDEFINKGVNSQLVKAYMQCDLILSDLLSLIEKYDASLIAFSEIGFGPLKKFVKFNNELFNWGFLNYKSNGLIDWNRTIAYESVQGSNGININKKHRNINGLINDNEYNFIVREIIDNLSSLSNPDTNKPFFKMVLPGSEYYNNCKNVPDIVFQPYDEEYLPYGDSYWSDYLNRDLQTGWHRSNGFYAGISKYQLPRKKLRVEELYPIIKEHI